MHLAVNGAFWSRPDTGSGQYTRQLVTHLSRLVSDLDISLILPQVTGVPEPSDVPAGVRVRSVPTRAGDLGKVLFEQFGFPRACRQIGATVAHVPYWAPPLQSAVPVVVTVHDVTTLLVREYRRGLRARLYNALVSAGARAAAHVVTDSLASRRDIIRHLGVAEGNTTAVYLAAGPEYHPHGDLRLDGAILKKYNLPEFYVLYLGGYQIHKNVTTLLQAYTYVAQALGEDYPLVLAGRRPPSKNPHFPDYEGYIAKLGVGPYVRWTGYIQEEDKPAVYRGACCFVFPSRHEGFGLPPLEAMACGVPVVASNCSSLPEVIGDAGFALDPDDDRQMGGSIIATIVQEDLAAELKQKGLDQAAKFWWEKTATETLLIYDKIAP